VETVAALNKKNMNTYYYLTETLTTKKRLSGSIQATNAVDLHAKVAKVLQLSNGCDEPFSFTFRKNSPIK